jgi:hypothetical protein
VAITGARLLGVTNCLNYGDPTRPEAFWQLSEGVRGLADACRALGLPVTGGNVSLYNESAAGAIAPTPEIGVVGLLDDVALRVGPAWRSAGDRVLLVGDAANQADPLNGGGIHKAMEGASLAADAAFHALTVGDFSHRTLSLYERLWEENFETDWRTAEFFLAVAKNPALKEFCLFLLTQIGRLTTEDRRFQEFASGVFSGTVAQSACLSPLALYRAFPKNPDAWLSLVQGDHGVAAGSAQLVGGAVGSLTRAAARMVRDPVRNLDWGLEVAVKAVQLAERGVQGPARGPAADRYLPALTPANGKA